MMKYSWLPILAALVACTEGQGQIDVTETHEASFPGLAADSPLRAMMGSTSSAETTIHVDARSYLSSIGDVGTMNLSVTKNEITGTDLSFLQHLTVTIAATDGTIPERMLSDVDVPPDAHTLDLPLLIPAADLLNYLKEGPISLQLIGTGTLPPQEITVTHSLEAHVTVEVHHNLI
jgi:hypothetical protein